MRSWSERWQPGNYERNVTAVEQLTALAADNDITVCPAAHTARDTPRR